MDYELLRVVVKRWRQAQANNNRSAEIYPAYSSQFHAVALAFQSCADDIERLFPDVLPSAREARCAAAAPTVADGEDPKTVPEGSR